AFTLLTLALGNLWWNAEAKAYGRIVYKPLALSIRLPELAYSISDPGWLPFRRIDDFVADHGHVMHLFAFDERTWRLYHLHPEAKDDLSYRAATHPDEPGRYRVFADVVHQNGLPETAVGEFELARPIAAPPPSGDDSVAAIDPSQPLNDRESPLESGGRM